MSEPINLNRARKARERTKKRAQADENAAKFGRSEAQKSTEKAQADRIRRELDGHKRDDT